MLLDSNVQNQGTEAVYTQKAKVKSIRRPCV